MIVAQKSIPASHTVVTDAAVEATCTTAGKTEGSHCSVCNEVIVAQESIPATGHIVVTDAAVAPTCTTAGKTEGSHCSVCNEIIVAQESILATGHTVVTDAAVAPTCTTVGKTEGSHCSVCNEVIVAQESIPATGHGDTKIKNRKSATYLSEGYTGDVYCTVCGKKISSGKKIAKLSAKRQTIKVKKVSVSFKTKNLVKRGASFLIGATAQGRITYKVTKGASKYISVSSSGKVTMKKGCKKGVYKISVTAAPTRNGEYQKATKVITIRVS